MMVFSLLCLITAHWVSILLSDISSLASLVESIEQDLSVYRARPPPDLILPEGSLACLSNLVMEYPSMLSRELSREGLSQVSDRVTMLAGEFVNSNLS